MRQHALALLLVATLLATGACVVPSFDVDPAGAAIGGDASGSSNGGKSAGGGTGGKSAGGGTAASGGGGTSTGGAQATAGTDQTGGVSNEAGAPGNEAGAPGNASGPLRIGVSLYHDSAGGSDDASGDSTDAKFTKPDGTKAGDFMLVFLGVDHNLSNLSKADLAPGGWKLLDQHGGYGVDGQGAYLLYKVATDAEPDSIVFANVNPEHYGVQGLLSVYRGVTATNPINDYATSVLSTGSSLSVHVDTPTPPITTTVDGCLLIAGLSPDTAIDAPQITMWPAGFDENPVSVTNPGPPTPNGWTNIYSVERHQSKAGAVPASTFGWDMTYGGKEYYGSLTFVLALAPAP